LEWRSRELVSVHATEATEPVNIVNVGYKSTNYFAIGSTGTPLLVDCGWPGTMPLLLANLKRADIALSALKYLLVTHFHPDHAGLAQELKQAGLTLLVFEGQEPFIAPLKQWMKPEMHYQDITRHDNRAVTFAGSRAFLRSIGIDGQVIPTPGHSDDSVTLILDRGDAFVGDLTAPFLVTDENAATVAASWDAIRAAGATTIHHAHAPMRRL
jgi:glyoxylase-like metal-dependent hydrolase (beta-lactamase superfamily II)